MVEETIERVVGDRAAARPHSRARRESPHAPAGLLDRLVERRLAPVERRLPKGAGLAVSTLILVGSIGFGIVRGGHGGDFVDVLCDWRDAAANAAGFSVRTIALDGNRQMTREEILATAGVTGRTSLLFLDVDRARERLKTNPWIADATVLKLYPGALKIAVTERKAFALWQQNGRVAVIAADGTVLEPYVARRFTVLPLVVGEGAQTRAQDFLATIARFPAVAGQVRASVLVAERRWNLRLKNGVDVRLPEQGVDLALATLSRLDAERQLMSRDVIDIDLRLPDRVTVRLSDEAAAARDDLFKDKKLKRKGNNA